MARASKKELAASISNSKKEDSINTEDTPQIKLPGKYTIYDKAGQICEVLPKDQIMASCSRGDKTRYFEVRVNIDRYLYDPYDTNYAANAYKKGRLLGTSPFKMVKVDEGTFNSYVQYLKNKNKKYLNDAQRGVK